MNMKLTESDMRGVAWVGIIMITSFLAGGAIVRHVVATQTANQYALWGNSVASVENIPRFSMVDQDAAVLSAHLVKIGNPALQGCGCPSCCSAS